jgi:tetratricopeptide (TPR) repeat protein
VAKAIESVHGRALDDHLPALAHHWARASAPAADADRAIDYAARAGDRALAQLAYDEAAAYYHQAVELLAVAEGLPDDGRRVELLIGLGEAQRRAGDPAHRETLLEAARLAADRGDADAQARAVLANGRGVWVTAIGEVDHERVAALEAALAVARPDDSPARARLLAALGLELTYMVDPERRIRLADEALAIARICGDAATLAHVLLYRFFTIPAPSTLPERLANSAELIPLAESLGDPGITARALLQRARCLFEAGDIQAADRALQGAERLADDLAQPTLRWLVGLIATTRILMAADLEEGERRARAGFELGQSTGQGDAPTYLAAFLFLIRLDQGRLGELEEILAERVVAVPNLLSIPTILALILCELDRLDEATEYYERVAARFGDLPVDPQWMLTVPYCAVVCAQLGDRPRARLLFDLLAPCASEVMFGAFLAAGAKAHYLALLATTLGDFDEAERRFSDAATIHERIGAPHWLARTRLEWARMLLRRDRPGDTQRAQDLLGQALTIARERNLANIERRAVQLLT